MMSRTPKYIYSPDGVNVARMLTGARPGLYGASGNIWCATPRNSFADSAWKLSVGIYDVVPATVPDGHRVLGRSYTRSGDTFVETLTTEAIPTRTNAEIAAEIVLSRSFFLQAVAAALGQDPDDVVNYLVTAITASTLSADDKSFAIFLLRDGADDFYRVDPLYGEDLLVGVAIIVGFGAPVGGWTIEPIEDRISAAKAALDVLFIEAWDDQNGV